MQPMVFLLTLIMFIGRGRREDQDPDQLDPAAHIGAAVQIQEIVVDHNKNNWEDMLF